MSTGDDGPDDRALIEALGRGEQAPLGVLYLRYGKLVYSVLNRAVPGQRRADLEDLCQEVFMAVFDQAARYREAGQLRAWVCGIAVRKAREQRRKRWLHRNLIERFFAPEAERLEPSHAASSDTRFDVGRALTSLPSAFREVMMLSLIDGLSGEEIAAALGVPINTVWTRLHRGRALLRAALEHEPEGGAP